MTLAGLSRSNRVASAPRRLAKGQGRRATRGVGSRAGFVGLAPRLDAAISALPPRIQAKLEIGRPNDRFEREADRVAGQVMRMAEPTVQRACACGGACPSCRASQRSQEHGHLQTERAGREHGGAWAPGMGLGPHGLRQEAHKPLLSRDAPPVVHQTLARPGLPLDRSTREFMEARFGADFGTVRVHTDALAGRSSRAVGARAYTVGEQIVFESGPYLAQTASGRRLLAHELVHVLQQRRGLSASTSLAALSGEDVLQRAVHPALIAALAILVVMVACGLPYHQYALSTYGRKTDKWRHCWVSCQMSKTCGPVLAELAGLGKEIRDRAVAAFCDQYPNSSVCAGGHGDFLDSIGDLAANQACIPWETFLVGPLARIWRQSCRDCCDASGL